MFWARFLTWALSFATFVVYKDKEARGDNPEQQALLERALQADPQALTELYDQYVDRIHSYIYHRVGQVELAEDLTAQVFIKMLEAIRGGRGWRTTFVGWLYRIAHNLVIDHYRRRGRASFVDIEDAGAIQATDGDPVRSTESVLDREHLHRALSLLTEDQAQVITLRFLEDRSIAETAELLEKTEGAIKALQYRAVLALRRVM